MNTRINTILFDLDGTLLPMDQDIFIKIYFHKLAEKFAPLGYDPKKFIKAVMAGTESMIKNDGRQNNEATFWETFIGLINADYQSLESTFLDFYQNDFDAVQQSTKTHPLAKLCVEELINKGYEIALATNPLFPQVATYKRIKWAGLNPDDFIHVTTYENSSYCKPNLKYYEEILSKINKKPEECLMVGNDVNEDMIVTNIGIKTFLLTDCIINPHNVDLFDHPQGDFKALYEYIKELPVVVSK